MREDVATEGAEILRRFARAKQARTPWEAHWRECYDHVLPANGPGDRAMPGAKRGNRLFDATAADAAGQLAASLLAQLTPPWSRWFRLSPGPDIAPEERPAIAEALERASTVLQSHFDRSNFAMEAHQCHLDLVTAGTACLLFEEEPPGRGSAFRFAAVPLFEAVLEEGTSGALDVTWRRTELTPAQFRHRYPKARLPDGSEPETPERRIAVVEHVSPRAGGYDYRAVLDGQSDVPAVLSAGMFERSPFVNFRWLKAPGESYGRSPVMQALPDIKTANKVVELVLKNASIAVTGIWQADDDGVLNPATVRLVPGAIIPKAVGSNGLKPLEAPGRFDVSQLVLDDLRGRIRHALLADRLGQVEGPRMTATEVLERSAEMARVLGATYGRLQSEFLSPLVERGLSILRRRGEIPDIRIDGRLVELRYGSPLADIQDQEDVRKTLLWLQSTASLGPDATAAVDAAAAARWMARKLGVPAELVRDPPAAGAGDLIPAIAEAADAVAS